MLVGLGRVVVKSYSRLLCLIAAGALAVGLEAIGGIECLCGSTSVRQECVCPQELLKS